jgi:hypothetical protein
LRVKNAPGKNRAKNLFTFIHDVAFVFFVQTHPVKPIERVHPKADWG